MNIDTFDINNNFFSARRALKLNHDDYGRNISIIMLNQPLLMKLLSGNSNKPLSKSIAKYLKSKLVNSSIRNFSDGEIYVEINENIRGNSIFLIQSVSSPANDNLMELLQLYFLQKIFLVHQHTIKVPSNYHQQAKIQTEL